MANLCPASFRGCVTPMHSPDKAIATAGEVSYSEDASIRSAWSPPPPPFADSIFQASSWEATLFGR
ncbi:hypothetical protein C8Q73DRAFT_679264 [Cubamyces lactineus]|nr:hypothetical protein C8Q73DRAFT_679264 [Cubamyces lactineus]